MQNYSALHDTFLSSIYSKIDHKDPHDKEYQKSIYDLIKSKQIQSIHRKLKTYYKTCNIENVNLDLFVPFLIMEKHYWTKGKVDEMKNYRASRSIVDFMYTYKLGEKILNEKENHLNQWADLFLKTDRRNQCLIYHPSYIQIFQKCFHK